MEVSIHESISQVSKSDFNRTSDPRNPFLEYEFLEALESSGCVGEQTSWKPRYMQLSEAGCVLANLVFYIKNDSYGEYIFDWEWAQMFHQAGLSYFPKVVAAVPFTPANGSRFLHDPKINLETCAQKLTQTLMEYCQESSISSIHFLCLTRKEQAFLEKFDFLSRLTHQFHWKNNGYGIFDDFMDDLRSKRKKQIRKERESIRNQGIRVSFMKGEDVREKHIDAVWSCYQNTHFRKWGSAYLNQNFFERIFQNHSRRIILVLAEKSNEIIAASFNYHKADHLFGRYWGARWAIIPTFILNVAIIS